MAKKIVRLTERDVTRLINKILNEQPSPNVASQGQEPHHTLRECSEILSELVSRSSSNRMGSGEIIKGVTVQGIITASPYVILTFPGGNQCKITPSR